MNRNTLLTDIHTNKILLSIIVPIYNTGKYIGKCLESLTAQNLSLEKYEIICINDGSTDNSCVIVESYAKKFSNIRFVSQENKGVSAARNKGIHLAKGKYIWFVDSDDFIKSNVLAQIAGILIDGDCDRLTLLPFAFRDNEENDIPIEVTAEMYSVTYKDWLWTQIFKTNLIVDNHIRFDEEVSYAEDSLFVLQITHLLINRKK